MSFCETQYFRLHYEYVLIGDRFKFMRASVWISQS